MRAGRVNRVAITRTEWRGAAIFGLLLAIFVVRFFVDTPGLSLVFLAIFPIVLAAFALGRNAAIACGALAAALSVVVPIISPGTDVSTSAQIVGGVFRTVVFVGLGALVAELIDRAAVLRRQLADSEAEVRELESLRAALTSPELPSVDGLTIATSYTPADGPVAGDFFLVAPSSDDTVLVVVGDVVGHGLAAARRASFVRATISLFAEHTNDPMSILRLANTALAEREPGTEYVTALCAIFAADRATVTWASAGHPAPWDLDHAEPLAMRRHCIPLGIEPVLDGETMTTRLRPGGGLLLYTDGLPEARTTHGDAARPRRPGRDLFGEQAARDTLRRLRGSSPEEIVTALRSAAVAHAEGAPADDLCLVAIRRGLGDGAQPQAA
jgi:serine phosphatase RsbU (regulator of sigma subunit)